MNTYYIGFKDDYICLKDVINFIVRKDTLSILIYHSSNLTTLDFKSYNELQITLNRLLYVLPELKDNYEFN